jgi:hypothetical protein
VRGRDRIMCLIRIVTFLLGILTLEQVGSELNAQPVPCLPVPGLPPAIGGVAVIPETPPLAMMVSPQSEEEKKWDITALQGCSKLKSLINPANSRLLGFEQADDARVAQIGKPIDIYSIGLNKIRAYKPGDPVSPLIRRLDSRIYPLSVSGTVRSSLVVSRVKDTGTFTTTAYGLVKLITLVMKYKKSESDFVVWLPALNLHFLGDHPDETLKLTPLATRDLYGLKEGVPVQAAVVFALLAQQARAHDEHNPG